MVKCDCWVEHGPYCNGTKEQETCYCNGDRRKCDFYEDVREKAVLEAAQRYSETLTKAFIPFHWYSMKTAPRGFDGEHPDILVCYIDKGVPKYKTFKFLDKCNMESAFIAKHAVAWCYIEQPKNLMTKEEAVKNLKNAGIFDEAGNLKPIYESILIKVEDL